MKRTPLVLVSGRITALPAGDTFFHTGDMDSSVYDPTGVHGDAFDRSHHYGSVAATTFTGLGEVAFLNVGSVNISDRPGAPPPPSGQVAPGNHVHVCCSGDMWARRYDPTGIADDVFDRQFHTGTQSLSTISDAGAAAYLDVGTTHNSVAAWAHTHDSLMATSTYDPTGIALNPLDRSNHVGVQPVSTLTGVGTVALMNVGTTYADVAAGDHVHPVFTQSESGWVPVATTDLRILGSDGWTLATNILDTLVITKDHLPRLSAGVAGVPPEPTVADRTKVLTGVAWRSVAEVLRTIETPLPLSQIPSVVGSSATQAGTAGLCPAGNVTGQVLLNSGTWGNPWDALYQLDERKTPTFIPATSAEDGQTGIVPRPTQGTDILLGQGWNTIGLATNGVINPDQVPFFTTSVPGRVPTPPAGHICVLTGAGWETPDELAARTGYQIDTSVPTFTPPTATTPGTAGLVPTPTNSGQVLSASGWIPVPTGLVYRGVWTSGVTAARNEIRKHDNGTWVSTIDNNTEVPGVGASWNLMSRPGCVGSVGPESAWATAEMALPEVDGIAVDLRNARFLRNVARVLQDNEVIHTVHLNGETTSRLVLENVGFTSNGLGYDCYPAYSGSATPSETTKQDFYFRTQQAIAIHGICACVKQVGMTYNTARHVHVSIGGFPTVPILVSHNDTQTEGTSQSGREPPYGWHRWLSFPLRTGAIVPELNTDIRVRCIEDAYTGVSSISGAIVSDPNAPPDAVSAGSTYGTEYAYGTLLTYGAPNPWPQAYLLGHQWHVRCHPQTFSQTSWMFLAVSTTINVPLHFTFYFGTRESTGGSDVDYSTFLWKQVVPQQTEYGFLVESEYRSSETPGHNQWVWQITTNALVHISCIVDGWGTRGRSSSLKLMNTRIDAPLSIDLPTSPTGLQVGSLWRASDSTVRVA